MFKKILETAKVYNELLLGRAVVKNDLNLVKQYGGFRKAFTLAEVLITLGVIGVVAALTLPTIIQNHQKQVYVTSLKKAYNIMSNLFTGMASYEGVTSWKDLSCSNVGSYTCGADSSEAFNLNHSACLNSIKRNLKTLNIEEYNEYTGGLYGSRGITIYTTDGIVYTLFFDGFDWVDDSFSSEILGVGHIEIDTNGKKGPNLYGRDRFNLYLDYEKNKIQPINNFGSSYCTTEKVQNGRASGCFIKIIEDGWKMNY